MNIGFDLDLTLADTRQAMAVSAAAISQKHSLNIEVDEFMRNIGLSMRDHLAPWVPEGKIDDLIPEFRTIFLTEGLKQLIPLPGAQAALDSVRRHGGRSIIITSRLPHVAQAMLENCELHPDMVIGGLTGAEKASAITSENVRAYVGDHVLDMRGAKLAGCTAVGVLTGYQTEHDLREAGADFILAGLVHFDPALYLK